MKVFETISAQSGAMRLPLVAVSAAAIARADTPIILILHWHGFRRATPVSLPGIKPPPRPIAGSAMQINQPWHNVETVDQAMLDAAWQLGAWDVERLERRPWWRLGAPDAEALACRQAFGEYPAGAGHEPLVAETPDREELLRLAAIRGYIRWLFRPRKGGLWKEVEDDDGTLDGEGGRSLPCPVRPRPLHDRTANARTIYRLGRATRIVFSGRR